MIMSPETDSNLNTRNLKPGQTGWVPTSFIKPSQPDDGRKTDYDDIISIDRLGNIVHGNHRYYSMHNIVDEMHVRVVADPM